jgi:hypothetical protein
MRAKARPVLARGKVLGHSVCSIQRAAWQPDGCDAEKLVENQWFNGQESAFGSCYQKMADVINEDRLRATELEARTSQATDHSQRRADASLLTDRVLCTT